MKMKSIRLFFLVGIIASACAKESCPYLDVRYCDRHFRDSIAALEPDTSGNGSMLPDTGIVSNGRVLFNPSTFSNVERVALLEYYTGFRCANCPPASATAKNIKNNLGSRVELIFMHATSAFAAPTTQPPAPYSTDLRTDEGNTFTSTFQLSGLPAGVINRKKFTSVYAVPPGSWADRVNEELAEDASAFIRLRKIKQEPGSNEVTIQVAYRILQGDHADYRLTVGLNEMGIIEAQKDGPNDVFPYTHDYVFRGNVNGLYGVELSSPTPALQPEEALLETLTFQLNPMWNQDNLVLFAYLHHSTTREVIQISSAYLNP